MVQLLECTFLLQDNICKTILSKKKKKKEARIIHILYLFTLFWRALSFTDSRGKKKKKEIMTKEWISVLVPVNQ